MGDALAVARGMQFFFRSMRDDFDDTDGSSIGTVIDWRFVFWSKNLRKRRDGEEETHCGGEDDDYARLYDYFQS